MLVRKISISGGSNLYVLLEYPIFHLLLTTLEMLKLDKSYTNQSLVAICHL